jgi:NADPH2 dehydrogenase
MLFEPITIKDLTAKNRVVMPPMCQYMAKDGMANNWHLIHYATRAVGQVGTIILEATAIEPRGRISMNDLGLWDNKQVEPMKRIVEICKEHGTLVGVQLAHAGRKSQVKNEKIVAPSPIAFSGQFPEPHELTGTEIYEISRRFAEAAYRARKAGFDFIEIHAAHGYLINEFLSPVTNHRSDKYGQQKDLFLEEIIMFTKQVLPSEMPIFLRVSGEEYHPEGNHPEDLSNLLLKVKNHFDVLHVSSGGVYEKESYDVYPAYQLDYAEKLKKITNMPTIAVGRLEKPLIAEQALIDGKADMIAIGKALLSDPYWTLHAARILNFDLNWPEPYLRAKSLWNFNAFVDDL